MGFEPTAHSLTATSLYKLMGIEYTSDRGNALGVLCFKNLHISSVYVKHYKGKLHNEKRTMDICEQFDVSRLSHIDQRK